MYHETFGNMNHPRVVTQMTKIIKNCYFVKVSTWGEGVKIAQNSIHVVCTRPNVSWESFFCLMDKPLKWLSTRK